MLRPVSHSDGVVISILRQRRHLTLLPPPQASDGRSVYVNIHIEGDRQRSQVPLSTLPDRVECDFVGSGTINPIAPIPSVFIDHAAQRIRQDLSLAF